MSITREEAIRALERADGYVGIHYINGVEEAYINPHLREAVKVALAALRSPTREIVERMRGEWIEDEGKSLMHSEKIYLCSRCNNFEAWGETEKTNFCPACGAPMTAEAVDMMLERWREALDENT